MPDPIRSDKREDERASKVQECSHAAGSGQPTLHRLKKHGLAIDLLRPLQLAGIINLQNSLKLLQIKLEGIESALCMELLTA